MADKKERTMNNLEFAKKMQQRTMDLKRKGFNFEL
jgi:hypothetical protein